MWKLYQRIEIFCLALLISGCTVKAYEGPLQSDDQISSITIRSSGVPTVESIVIDGQSFRAFGNVFQVLPGRHPFEVGYRLEQPDACDSDDLFCALNVEYGKCRGEIRTLPGRAYLITLSNDGFSVKASALAKGYFDLFVRSDEPEAGYVYCR